MYSRCCALAGALICTPPALATNAVSFQDWTGAAQSSTLPDRSVLTEYVARTVSGNTAGAELLVSFSPRFNCTPMLGFLLPSELIGQGNSTVEDLSVRIDQLSRVFPVLVDTEQSKTRFSLDGDSGVQQIWRIALDNGSRVRVALEGLAKTSDQLTDSGSESVADAASDDPDAGQSVAFSLLGSRLTVLELENRCKAHNPIPFDN